MEDESSAVAMVNYFTNCAATLRERSVYVQFSNHRELKTDQVKQKILYDESYPLKAFL